MLKHCHHMQACTLRDGSALAAPHTTRPRQACAPHRILGAPVMLPPGKAARRQSTIDAPGRRSPRTVLTIWCTVGKRGRG